MYSRYLKVAFRNLLKNKAFTLTNIFGLTIGMSAFLLILNYVQFELSFDDFHNKGQQLYRIKNDHFSNGSFTYSRAITYRDAGPSLKEEIPGISDYTRLNGLFGRSVVFAYSDLGRSVKFTEDNGFYADQNLLTMFSFPLEKGDPNTALNDENSIVLTSSTAKKYFGSKDPIGEIITINGQRPAYVTAILKDIPLNSHMKFDFLLPMSSLPEYQDRNEDKWAGIGGDVAYTYVLLEKGADPKSVEAKFPDFLKKHQSAFLSEQGTTDEFILQPVRDIHLKSDIGFEMNVNGNSKTVTFLTIIASIVLFIAWINYINLATVKATERSAEVGVRKVIGATKWHLAKLFLTEALLLNFFALIISVVGVLLLFPVFLKFTGLEIEFVLLSNLRNQLLMVTIFFLGALLSGLYPAFVLSSFKPIDVLKGMESQKFKGVSLVKGLTVFQYAFSVALITGTIAVFEQVNFMRNQDLGVDVEQVVVIKAPEVIGEDYLSTLKSLRNEVLKYPEIKGMSASSEIPGKPFNATTMFSSLEASYDESKRYTSAWVDYNFLPFFKLEMLSGRNFSEEYSSDEEAVVVNEEFVKSMGYKNPDEIIGESFNTNRGATKVIGVIDNYHQVSLKNAIEPAVFFLNSWRSRKYLSFGVNTENIKSSMNLLQKEYENIFPGNPFEFFFLDEYFNQQYKADNVFGKVFLLFSSLAIFITCLGLFNLSYITTLNRIKEISVRKVLGASTGNILLLVSADFLRLMLIGALIGTPLIWIVLRDWLSNYAYRIDISVWILITPIVLTALVAAATVSYHILKAAHQNPAVILQYE